MTRARISNRGIEIAMPGYSVDTAPPSKMLFSPDYSALRVALTGTLTVADYSGSMSDSYWRGIVSFNPAFQSPPVVLVSGRNSATESVQSPFVFNQIPPAGTGRKLPFYTIQTYRNRFELYVLRVEATGGVLIGPKTRVWRYWVLHNVLE